jgi:hypothetical protein
MKFLIFVFLFFLIGISFIKRREIALWTADPLVRCVVLDETSDNSGENISYSRYTLKNEAKKKNKALLILPPTGGKNIIDEGYALNFCRRGFDVFILERSWETSGYSSLDFNIHQDYQTKIQKAFRSMIMTIDKMGYSKLNVLGTSAGSIDMNVTLGIPEVASKISSYFNIVAGVGLCEIIATTGEKGLRALRKRRMKELNIGSMKDYQDKICDALKWQSAQTLPEHIKFGAIISMKDETVATKFQLEMVERYKPSVLVKSDFNHFYTVVSSYFLHKYKIINFFKKD